MIQKSKMRQVSDLDAISLRSDLGTGLTSQIEKHFKKIQKTYHCSLYLLPHFFQIYVLKLHVFDNKISIFTKIKFQLHHKDS